MFTFLLVCHVIVALALVGVILMQRSEGGGLTGGSPTGLMSARGAGDFLTRTTTILATVFVLLSIALAAVATVRQGPSTIDTSLAKPASSGAVLPTDAATNSAAPAEATPVPLAVPTTQPTAAETPRERPAPARQERTTSQRPAAAPATAPASAPAAATTPATPPVASTTPAPTENPQ